MARSKRDDLKRKIAQAVNHIADAVLAVYAVRQEFDPVHPEQGEYLKAIETALNMNREAVLQFAAVIWLLDEERLAKYL